MNKPNIIFILADDLGAWALHCAGTKELHTPNIDRLANEGMRFENFFCASPVCSPARASILTGTIPSAHGVHDWLRGGNVDPEKYTEGGSKNPYSGSRDEGTPIQYLKDMVCYTDLMRECGYNIALSGKWHLGDSVHPQHGFSKWYTIGKGGCNYYHPDIVEGDMIHVHHGEYITDLITDKAVEFIDELNGENAPFYLSVHYTAPHAPWGRGQHPERLIDMYDSCTFDEIPNVPDHVNSTTSNGQTDPIYGTPKRHENLRGYYAAITAMDEGVGRILEKLDALNLTDNTVVIFTADNGMSMGHHGIWGKGNGTFPMNMYDTAVKVPFIIRWPGHTPEGYVTDAMVSAYDIFPTLSEIIGSKSKAHMNLPGKSFLKTLLGEEDAQDGEVVVFDEYGPVRMIRTKKLKYVHRYPYGPNELFDLENDPGEEINLIDREDMQETIIEMRARLQKWFVAYADPMKDGIHEGVTGSGQMCSAGVYAEREVKYAPIEWR